MKYLLDASVLLPLTTSRGKQLISEASKQNLFTTDLAIYEACNTLWKLSTLLKMQQTSPQQSKTSLHTK